MEKVMKRKRKGDGTVAEAREVESGGLSGRFPETSPTSERVRAGRKKLYY
jgi:hypothetical protein